MRTPITAVMGFAVMSEPPDVTVQADPLRVRLVL